MTDTATERLRRLLLVIPRLLDASDHSLAELAEFAGTDVGTIIADLRELVSRDHPEPAGFVDSVSLVLDSRRVRMERPHHFRRPAGLSPSEASALSLAVAVVQQESPPEMLETLARARQLIAKASTIDGDTPDSGRVIHLASPDDPVVRVRAALDACMARGVCAELKYQSASDAEPRDRLVGPLGFVLGNGTWYLVAESLHDTQVKAYRFDRIHDVQLSTTAYSPAPDFDLAETFSSGRVFIGAPESKLKVRFSSEIARWICEQEGVTADADGSVTMEYPLADHDWAVGFVLRHGAVAEVLEPESVRAAVRETLDRMLTQSEAVG